MDPYAYSEKINKAVWHGRKTGHWEYADVYSRELGLGSPYVNRSHPRRRIVSLGHPDLLDSSFEKMPWGEYLRYKYVVTVSGNSYAGLLKPALLSNSCVLRQDPMAGEWYEADLREWVHCVPVSYDLGDLLERIRWAREHDGECERIAGEGRRFALEHFSASAVNLHVHSAVNKR